MAKYLVNVVMSTCVEIEVEAQDEQEARAFALEEADPITAYGWDYDIDSIVRDDDEEENEEEDW